MHKKIARKIKDRYKKHPKRFWAAGAVIVIILAIILIPGKSKTTVTIVPLAKTDLKETVLATGAVTSNTDLALSFSASGTVRSVNVSVGDKVYRGQILAMLDNADTYAALKAAEAKYHKVAEGASTEEIAVAEAALNSAESDLANKQSLEDTLVANAHRKLLNNDLTPILANGTAGVAPTITGTYSGSDEGSYLIQTYGTGAGGNFSASGLENGSGLVNGGVAVPLGTRGLFIQFPSGYSAGSATAWSVLLPNTKSTTYVTYLNAYNEAVNTRASVLSAAQSVVKEKQASLALTKAAARTADLELAEADQLAASAAYEKTILRAPANGTITRVDVKLGETATAQKDIMTVQDVGNLYVEAKINEANIARVRLDEPVTMTLDAFGPTVFFSGTVVHIDPSATTDDGIANYKIKTSIKVDCLKAPEGRVNDCVEAKDIIRPGMNANLTITAGEKPDVIAVAKAAIETKDGKSYVNVVTDEKKKKYESREVTTGIDGDGNRVEIVSGLSAGEKIAIIQK